MRDSRLEKLKIRDAEYVKDESGVPVLHVRDPHALSQAAGYLKHVHGSDSHQHIYFRGQTKLYGSLEPSLFRGSKRTSTRSKRIGDLKARIRSVADSHQIFKKFSETFYEPLLQHYGFQTTWVDLVDNIWIALWFACNSAVTSGANAEYLHFEQRKPDAWNDCVYIILVGADLATDLRCEPGFIRGAGTEVVDLRVGAPSIFLRPHSQHGLLFRVRGDHVSRPNDYSSHIRGIIRAELCDALGWIGRGALLNVHSLFPPPSYDRGYGLLLDSNLGHQGHVGGITHIGA
jgi:hypothetical protein